MVVINRHIQNGRARYQTFRARVADHIGSKFCFPQVLVPAEVYVARKVFSEVSRKRFLAWICAYWYFNQCYTLWSILDEYNRNCHYYSFGHEREHCEGILKYVLVGWLICLLSSSDSIVRQLMKHL